jgi:hypothetical protein
MADKVNINPFAPELPPEAIAFATKMYDAARAGQVDIFQQALTAGLPANMTNDKGDSLVGLHSLFYEIIEILLSGPRVLSSNLQGCVSKYSTAAILNGISS